VGFFWSNSVSGGTVNLKLNLCMQVEYIGRLMPITKFLPSFQSPAAAEAVLRKMQEGK